MRVKTLTNLALKVVAITMMMLTVGKAHAGITGIANASMTVPPPGDPADNDEFPGWFTNEIVADSDNIRFHNNTLSVSSSGAMTLTGQLEFSQTVGFVDVGGNDFNFSVEIGKGTSANFANGYDFEVRIDGTLR